MEHLTARTAIAPASTVELAPETRVVRYAPAPPISFVHNLRCGQQNCRCDGRGGIVLPQPNSRPAAVMPHREPAEVAPRRQQALQVPVGKTAREKARARLAAYVNDNRLGNVPSR